MNLQALNQYPRVHPYNSTPMSSNGVSSTPTVAGASSSHQDKSAPGSTPLTTAAKTRSPLSDLLNLPNVHKDGSKTPSTGRARVLTSGECLRLLKEKEDKEDKTSKLVTVKQIIMYMPK